LRGRSDVSEFGHSELCASAAAGRAAVADESGSARYAKSGTADYAQSSAADYAQSGATDHTQPGAANDCESGTACGDKPRAADHPKPGAAHYAESGRHADDHTVPDPVANPWPHTISNRFTHCDRNTVGVKCK
jgi:hypothetical protein